MTTEHGVGGLTGILQNVNGVRVLKRRDGRIRRSLSSEKSHGRGEEMWCCFVRRLHLVTARCSCTTFPSNARHFTSKTLQSNETSRRKTRGSRKGPKHDPIIISSIITSRTPSNALTIPYLEPLKKLHIMTILTHPSLSVLRSFVRIRRVATSERLTDAEPTSPSAVHVAGQCFLKCRLRDRCICYIQVSYHSRPSGPKRLNSPSRSLKLLPMLGVPSLPSLE